MEVTSSFTLKPYQQSLSPPFASCISPTVSGRRQFFGHEFSRPPRRRKCCRGGLGFGVQFQSASIRTRRRFVFRTSAALDPQTVVVVVSFVAVSAITVLYFNYSKRKHEDDSNKRSHSLDRSASLQSASISIPVFENQKASTVGIQGQDTAREVKDLCHDFQNDSAQVNSHETVLWHEEPLTTGVSVRSGCDTIASSITESSQLPCEVKLSSIKNHIILESSFRELPTPMELSSPKSGVPRNLPTERSACFEKRQKTERDSELSMKKLETELITVSVPVKYKEAGDNTLERNYGPTEEGDISRYKCATLEFTHTGNPNEGMPGVKSFSSSVGSSVLQSERFSVKDFLHAAETFEAKLPHEQPERNGSRDFWKDRGSGSGKENGMLTKDDLKILFPVSQQKKKGSSIDYPSQQLRAYNHFLREGRLTDCLEKLEHLKRKGLLDMNNVYHMGFLRACTSQKAVKEAFRFLNLIPNPTLSTFNMLMSVCACSQDLDGALEVLQLVRKAGLKADCKLYTTLISTCAKSRKVDTMFKVFHEMVNFGVEPNVNTYGALIDGCAKAGQVAKAFGAYGIMRSKNVKPDRVVFNALISACGQSGAVDRAFDVLSEMRSETHPIDPDHVTVGALMKACVNTGQVERAREIYGMIQEFNIKGTPEVYTIAVNSCSGNGDWEFACNVFKDMTKNGVIPDEMFFSALIDVAGHAGMLDAAFEVLQEASKGGMDVGIISYSSLMGACSNAKNWKRALELYEHIITMRMKPAVSTMNALITALCDGDELPKAVEILSEMKKLGLRPNSITYSILLVASEKKDDLEVGLMLLSQAKKDGISPNLVMCRCLIALCYRRFDKACMVGEPVLSFDSGRLLIDSEWGRHLLVPTRLARICFLPTLLFVLGD